MRTQKEHGGGERRTLFWYIESKVPAAHPDGGR